MMKNTVKQILTTTTETMKETILDQSLTSIKDNCLRNNLISIPSLLLSTQNLLSKPNCEDDHQEGPVREPSPCHSECTPWMLEGNPSLDLARTRSQSPGWSQEGSEREGVVLNLLSFLQTQNAVSLPTRSLGAPVCVPGGLLLSSALISLRYKHLFLHTKHSLLLIWLGNNLYNYMI